jgi:hypothetical protein
MNRLRWRLPTSASMDDTISVGRTMCVRLEALFMLASEIDPTPC